MKKIALLTSGGAALGMNAAIRNARNSFPQKFDGTILKFYQYRIMKETGEGFAIARLSLF